MRAWLLFPSRKACSTRLSSGNQVDGLPLVANKLPCVSGAWWLVLEMCLFVLHAPLGNDRYAYDINVPKGACLSMDVWLSWSENDEQSMPRLLIQNHPHDVLAFIGNTLVIVGLSQR